MDRLTLLNPREVWANEASDFTPWLLKNGDVLAEALGLEIDLTGREHEVGGYFLDLIGVDLTNDCPLVVENQLTRTDHSHLGQLLTYAAGTDAKTIVWVAPEFRDEHRQAINYLNELTSGAARFFAVEVGVVRIGDSSPAPLMRLVAEPNNWRDAKGDSVGSSIYLNLWEKVVEELNTTPLGRQRRRTYGSRNWLVVERLTSNAKICCTFARKERLRVELYIDGDSPQECKDLFDRLQSYREGIESDIGEELAWEELEGKRACRIALYRDGDVQEQDRYEEYARWITDTVQRFRKAFTPERLSGSEI